MTSTQSLDGILDTHAKYYISKTIEYMKRTGEEPGFVTGKNEQDDSSKQAILQWVADEVVGKTTLEKSGGHYTLRYPLTDRSAAVDERITEQRETLKREGWVE